MPLNKIAIRHKSGVFKGYKSREKQITTVIENVVGIYGSVEGLVGGQKALPDIESLSLESVVGDEEMGERCGSNKFLKKFMAYFGGPIRLRSG